MRNSWFAPLFFCLFAGLIHAQPVQQVHPNPDCQFFFTLTAASSLPLGSGFDNRQQGCTSWNFSYVNSGFTGLTVTLQSAANNAGVAGSWGAGFPVQQSTVSGSNAATNTTAGFWWVQGTNAFVRVTLSGLTGSGIVQGAVFGWRIPNAASQGGGGGSGITCLTGDVTAGSGGGCTTATVVGIESVPFCSGYTPTNGQLVQYTTASSPNPCYTAATVNPGGGTVTSIATTSPITGGTITTTGTIACATCVVASSPAAGIAHFAGSTQTATSSAVSLTADVSGILPIANGGTNASSAAAGTVPNATSGTASSWVAAVTLGSIATAGSLKITANSAALPAPQTGTILQIGNANGTSTRYEADAFAATAFFSAVRADGTAASPTTLQANDQIGGVNGWGYDGTAIVGPQVSFRTFAAQNWVHSSALGTYADIVTTPNGSTTAAEVMRFENDGGVTLPSTVTGGDKGAGTVNAAGLYVNGVAVSTSTATGTVTSVTCGTGLTGGTITTSGTCAVAGGAGQILAGATPALTSTPTLGASGTLGSLTMGNATSGTVTIQPVTGALGSVTFSLPAITGTPLLGGNNITTSGCVAFETSSGVVTCSSNLIYNGASLTVFGGAGYQASRDANTAGAAGFAVTNTNQASVYAQFDAVLGSGTTTNPQFIDLRALNAVTLRLWNATASTGATRVEVALGAADTAATQILTVDGSMGVAGTITGGGAINLQTTTSPYLTLQNTTAALVGTTVQVSPSLDQCGTAWQTTAAASQTLCFQSYVLPVTGAALTGSWVLQANVNGGGFSNVFSVGQTGNLTINGVATTGVTGTGNVVLSANPTLTGTVTAAGFTLINSALSTTSGNATLTVSQTTFNTAGGGGLAINMATGTVSNTSGTDTGVQIQPTINSLSGAPNYTVLSIAPKVTQQGTSGAGTYYLTGWYAGSAGTTLEASVSFGGVLTDNGEIFTSAAPTVAASQIGFGSTVAASTNCGTLGTGCIVINVAGTTRYITYY